MTVTSPPNLGNIITSATVRKVIYSIFAVLGVALGAIQVGYSAASLGQPVWLTVAMAVYAFLGAAGLGVAVANAPTGTIGVDTGIPSVPAINVGSGD